MSTADAQGSQLVPLNYSTHFREWWEDNRAFLGKRVPELTINYEVAVALLDRAQHFLLPENGWLLDDDGILDAKYAPLLYLPYPVTAFEFHVYHEGLEMAPRERRCSKRIAVGVDAQTAREMSLAPVQADEWLCLSIYYVDTLQAWTVAPVAAIVSRSKTRIGTEDDRAELLRQREQARREGYIADRPDQRPLPAGAHVLDIGLGRLPGYLEQWPKFAAFSELRDELIAAIQACAALSCQNIGTRTLASSEALNKKRQARGKLPFVTYHVLDVRASSTSPGAPGSGTHASPRQHLRRGHIRHLSETRTTWVTSCVVGSASRGKVLKDYRLHAE
jgi:hypothetical protein